MKKVLVLFIALLFLVACGDEGENEEIGNNEPEQEEGEDMQENTEPESSEVEEVSSDDPLADVVKHFEEEGYTIGEETTKAAEMVGAVNGFGVEVNGEEIEFYLYESDSPDLEAIQSNDEYDMDGFILPAVANGNVVLLGHDEHPEKDKVIETFNNY